LLLHEELVGTTALHLDLKWIQNPLVRQIVGQRLAAQANESWQNLAAFLDECESPDARSLVTEAVAEERKIPNPELQLADVILKLRNQFLDRQITTLTAKVSQSQANDELLRDLQKLKAQKTHTALAVAKLKGAVHFGLRRILFRLENYFAP